MKGRDKYTLMTSEEFYEFVSGFEEAEDDDKMESALFYRRGRGAIFALFAVDVANKKYRFSTVDEYHTFKGTVPIRSARAKLENT